MYKMLLLFLHPYLSTQQGDMDPASFLPPKRIRNSDIKKICVVNNVTSIFTTLHLHIAGGYGPGFVLTLNPDP